MTYIACMTCTKRERDVWIYIYVYKYNIDTPVSHMHRILDEEIVPTMPCPACSRKLRIMVRHDPLPAGWCASYCLHKNCTTAHFAFGAAWLTVVLYYVYIYIYTIRYITLHRVYQSVCPNPAFECGKPPSPLAQKNDEECRMPMVLAHPLAFDMQSPV